MRLPSSLLSLVLCLSVFGSLGTYAPKVLSAPATVSIRPADVMALTQKVAQYQVAALAAGWVPPKAASDTADPKNWVQGALFVGFTALADHSKDPLYKATVFNRGVANHWQLGKRLYHADDHVIGQSYLWAAKHGAGPEAYAPLRAQFDTILAYPPTVGLTFRDYTDPRGVDCDQRWCWADALFMAPPVWFELANQTGQARYRDYALKELLATTDTLYDQDSHLYFRDSRFFDKRGPHGEKIFWSRGDGWVFAGLARSLPLLPQSPERTRLEMIFKDMARALVACQRPDGFWSPSLLADATTSRPESSGTAFFVYGLAWGLKSGLLTRAEVEPTVRRGWGALASAVHDDGKLGRVQAIGDQPDDVGYDDTQYYGVGAFLLAGTAIADLDLK